MLDLPDRVLQVGVPVETARSAIEDTLRRVQNRGNIPIDHRVLYRRVLRQKTMAESYVILRRTDGLSVYAERCSHHNAA